MLMTIATIPGKISYMQKVFQLFVALLHSIGRYLLAHASSIASWLEYSSTGIKKTLTVPAIIRKNDRGKRRFFHLVEVANDALEIDF